MKVVRLDSFGGPETLRLVDVIPPTPRPDEFLVRVHAAGINFADTQIRQNRYPMMPPLPAILGMEVAGTIEATGLDGGDPPAGTRVAASLFASGGGYAEFVTVNRKHVVTLPEQVSYADATALMMQGITALNMVRLRKPRGKTVLVNAAAGGVGSLLLQLARLEGAKKVFGAVGSQSKCEVVKELGADGCVSYGESDWVAQARAANSGEGFDVVYESVGGEVTRASLGALAPGGEMVVYGALNLASFALGAAELGGLMFGNQSVAGFALNPLLTDESLRRGLTDLFQMAADGKLRTAPGSIFPFSRAADAHRALEQRLTTGKVVLVPDALA